MIETYVLKCECGWQFLSLNKWVLKCPQCRDIVYTCRACGKEIDTKGRRKYCPDCASLIKKIYARHYAEEKRKYPNTFKKQMSTDNICDYDCANCKFSDCILPVDNDDVQGEFIL